MKRYPEGTKFENYFITTEAGALTVKRMVTYPDGRRVPARMEKKRYQQYHSREELQAFVDRINGRENRRAIQVIKTKLAFFPVALMEEFREQLQSEIPTKKDAKNKYQNLHRYCLRFFADHLNLKDPLQWKSNETKWGNTLMCEYPEFRLYDDGLLRSEKTIKSIIETANRLLKFLHKKMPYEIPAIVLEPISKAKFKSYEARRTMSSEEIGKFILPLHWALINKEPPPDIAPYIRLGYFYGLRRAETLACTIDDIKEDHLHVHVQLEAINKGNYILAPLKNRLDRKTPHWLVDPNDTYEIIEAAQQLRMHPDTLGKRFGQYMEKLGLPYLFHDLRRTFITRALDDNSLKEVMWAVGHSSTDVTMTYLRDDRELSNQPFIPRKLRASKKVS